MDSLQKDLFFCVCTVFASAKSGAILLNNVHTAYMMTCNEIWSSLLGFEAVAILFTPDENKA
ncbi:uncharacterized protein RCC_04430 [Ramularia collo-cygni]|uniref:Uncharacterized protein n=1 Tax=Ramularia collo-cygni TaxID=112498 RepID=A0A2D3V4X5_9PEZI|nr:uncharacterized protein RCC_04430 [Ramularia collo-cygni]CZT18586.1 uncharacterized protein RCC_04430 [Ramularia collo-cygni]